MTRKSLSILFIAVTVLVMFVAVYHLTKDSNEIAYHRERIKWFSENYASNYSTIIADESQRMDYISRWEEHRKALLELGYLVKKDFKLERALVSSDTIQELRRAISNAPFNSKEFSYSFPGATNVLHVCAYKGDLPIWEKVVSEFNARTNQ